MVNKSKEGDQSWIREIVNGDTDEGRRVMIQRCKTEELTGGVWSQMNGESKDSAHWENLSLKQMEARNKTDDQVDMWRDFFLGIFHWWQIYSGFLFVCLFFTIIIPEGWTWFKKRAQNSRNEFRFLVLFLIISVTWTNFLSFALLTFKLRWLSMSWLPKWLPS